MGVQQIQLRTEGRQNGDLGAVAPSQGFHSICKWVKSVFLLDCYGCIFHGNGYSAQLCQNFRIWMGVEPLPPGTPLLKFTYFQKFLTTNCTQWIFITLRYPAFENKAGRSLSQDSSYLRLGTMCRGENPFWVDQTATTEKWTAGKNGSLPWELTTCC
jgi:hypothetical protein